MNSTDRYLVMDTEDVGDALSSAEIRCLARLKGKISKHRRIHNKAPIQFGVVDTEWQQKALPGRTVAQSIIADENSRRPFRADVSAGLLTIETGINPLIDTFISSYHAIDMGITIRNRAGFTRDIAEVLSQRVPKIGPLFYASTNTAALEAISQGSVHATVKAQYRHFLHTGE